MLKYTLIYVIIDIYGKYIKNIGILCFIYIID